jgi:hypothetical protein
MVAGPIKRYQDFLPKPRSAFLNAESFRLQFEASANLPLASSVIELLRQAHDFGLTVVVAVMPLREQHRRLFYDTPWWSQIPLINPQFACAVQRDLRRRQRLDSGRRAFR